MDARWQLNCSAMGKRAKRLVGLLLVAMREQGLSSKLLVFEKQLEDQEVAVLEVERQVAVLELGGNFERLSDLVSGTQALESERQLAVVVLEDNFKQLSDLVAMLRRWSTNPNSSSSMPRTW